MFFADVPMFSINGIKCHKLYVSHDSDSYESGADYVGIVIFCGRFSTTLRTYNVCLGGRRVDVDTIFICKSSKLEHLPCDEGGGVVHGKCFRVKPLFLFSIWNLYDDLGVF